MNTDIAQERLRKRFAKWDLDGSGSLERTDLEQEGAKIAQAFGKSTSATEAQELKTAFQGMFDYLAKENGVSSEGSLTEDQFVSAAGKLIGPGAEKSFDGVLGPLMRGIVGLCDQDADGKINGDEFVAWMSGVGVDKSQADDAFQQIDKDGSGQLSIDELLGAVRDYHYGDLEVELLG